jgi:chemotaxis protein MotB
MKKPAKKDNGVPEWVLTYGDLMSLLLCFFILLAAFSELKQPREYQRVIDAIREALGVTGNPGSIDLTRVPSTSPLNMEPEFRPRADPQMRNSKSDDDNFQGRHNKVAMVHENDRRVIGGALEFLSAQHELSEDIKLRLATDVAPKIKDLKQRVIVRGHAWGVTDAASDGDRWKLSFDRASAVADYLIQDCGIHPGVLTLEVVGDAEPLRVPVSDVENAPVNRRVEVFLTDVPIEDLHPDPSFTGRGR